MLAWFELDHSVNLKKKKKKKKRIFRKIKKKMINPTCEDILLQLLRNFRREKVQ